MNVDDPLAFFRAEDTELARIRQEKSLRKKWRPPQPSQQRVSDPILRTVVWVPSIVIVALALIALTVRHEFQIRNLIRRDAERAATGQFSKRGVSFDTADVIPGWQCATDDDGWRVVAARHRTDPRWLRISPGHVQTWFLSAADGYPYPVDTSQPAHHPPSDKEIIAAFPYLRTINGQPVAH
jgi:hypothetical protein